MTSLTVIYNATAPGAMNVTTLNQTTINKPAAEITFDDVAAEVDLQFRSRQMNNQAPPVDCDGLGRFINLAAKNAFPTLSDKHRGICSYRNYERNHSNLSDMVWGMHSECSFALDILTA